ncbi:hypothetical protein CNY89_11475 [Amaricoccus sp. HAR-UPW-R2A-40]|nr:hypothetical protein CNY89_11475 [Amaricoccus sp. HAR-UPW-R2A-40]
MAILQTNCAAPLGSVLTFRLVTLVERAIDGALAWRRSRETARQLSRLSDEQLSDIGIARDEIPGVAGLR